MKITARARGGTDSWHGDERCCGPQAPRRGRIEGHPGIQRSHDPAGENDRSGVAPDPPGFRAAIRRVATPGVLICTEIKRPDGLPSGLPFYAVLTDRPSVRKWQIGPQVVQIARGSSLRRVIAFSAEDGNETKCVRSPDCGSPASADDVIYKWNSVGKS
jgi:hypothetical protein